MTITEPVTQRQPMSPRRRAAGPILGGLAALAATAVVWRVDPNLGGYPPCPLKVLTGLDCPGCGGLRCVHALAQGDIATAVDQNLFAVILLPLVAVWLGITILRRVRGSADPVTLGLGPIGIKVLWFTVIGFALVFTIVRNIPGVPFFASGIG